MLKVIFPVADVPVSVHEMLRAFTVHFPIFKLPFVSRFIWPDHSTFAIHIIIFEFTFVQFSGVSEKVLAVAVKLTVNEIALIISALEFESAMARFFSVLKVSSISYFIEIPTF